MIYNFIPGYTFIIGNAVLESHKENGDLITKWVVKSEKNDNAPSFPNDEITGKSNTRSPNYLTWFNFCKETGISNIFYDKSNFFRWKPFECIKLKYSTLKQIQKARKSWQKTSSKPPGFEDCPKYNKLTDSWEKVDEGKYDACLARLLWLEWWMDWALVNCENPAIYNY